MKDNQSFYDFISAYPIVEAKDCVKQDTIKKAAELLSQQTKYVGAKQNFVLNQFKSISKVFWLIQFICSDTKGQGSGAGEKSPGMEPEKGLFCSI